jgi:hypothetical protein
MTNRDYKEGFDAGIDFALTFVNDAFKTKFADLNELVDAIAALERNLRQRAAQVEAKEGDI